MLIKSEGIIRKIIIMAIESITLFIPFGNFARNGRPAAYTDVRESAVFGNNFSGVIPYFSLIVGPFVSACILFNVDYILSSCLLVRGISKTAIFLVHTFSIYKKDL